MAEDLKPCPFCGSPALLEEAGDHHGEWFNLGCSWHWGVAPDPDPGCPGGRLWYTEDLSEKAAAIAKWNSRPAPAPVSEGVREVIWKALCEYRLSNMNDTHGVAGFPLVDLCSNVGTTIETGTEELLRLADHIEEALSAISPVAGGTDPATWRGLDDEGHAELLVNGKRITTFPSYSAAEEAAERINSRGSRRADQQRSDRHPVSHDVSLEDQRLLAQYLFPAEWAAARNGRQRRNLRHRAITKVLIDDQRRRGASCANCRGFHRGPGDIGMVCEPNSGWDGYQTAQPDDLCPDWVQGR